MTDHGGYRRPTNPAPVSGPGQHSRRTDGKQPIMVPTGGPYGEAQDLAQIEGGAGMAQEPSMTAPSPVSLSDLSSGLTPLSAPSQDPMQPVTDGAAAGAGRGPDALGQIPAYQQDATEFKKYLPVLLDRASRDDTPQTFKNLVRQLVASL